MPMDRKLVRALLLSALVCPGAGHWVLGLRGRGVVLIAASLGLLGLFCVRLARWTLDLYRALMAELAASGDLLVDPGLIRSMHTRIYVENWWILLALALLWTLALGDLVRRR